MAYSNNMPGGDKENDSTSMRMQSHNMETDDSFASMAPPPPIFAKQDNATVDRKVSSNTVISSNNADHNAKQTLFQPDAPESSLMLETAPIEPTHLDETISEEAVREHLKDVESSFLPSLSPIPTGANNSVGGVDDTFLFDSPQKVDKAPLPPPMSTDPDTSSASHTSALEHLDSSPTAAAIARTISRAVSSSRQAPAAKDAGPSNDQDDSSASKTDDYKNRWSQSSLRHQAADAGSTPGFGLKARRPEYLRSRFASQRSSASSFATNPESQDGSDVTVGQDTYGAPQPALGMPRVTSNPMPRSFSIGSMASGISADEYADGFLQPLETLPEVESPLKGRGADGLATPKASKENFNAPTDTVIAQHVRNVQVPEALAKQIKMQNGFQTPFKSTGASAVPGTASRTGKNLTLKEQSSTIERLSKENFDLKLKIVFLNNRLDTLSEEGVKEMISQNVTLTTELAIAQRENKILRKRVKELEKKSEEERPNTSSSDHTSRLQEEETMQREQETVMLREHIDELNVQIETLYRERERQDAENRKLNAVAQVRQDRSGGNADQEEAAVFKDLLDQETSRNDNLSEENQRLYDDIGQLRRELATLRSQGPHTTNIYQISKRRDGVGAAGRPGSELSADTDTNFSVASTLVEELRRESDTLRQENVALRRDLSAQTSMLSSRNREKDRLYQEIEELKIAHLRGIPASASDSILERSASRAGVHESPGESEGGRSYPRAIHDEGQQEELEERLAEMRDKMSEVKILNQDLRRELNECIQDLETSNSERIETERQAQLLQEDFDNLYEEAHKLEEERNGYDNDMRLLEAECDNLEKEANSQINTLRADLETSTEQLQRAQADLAEREEDFTALQKEMGELSSALLRLEDDQNNKLFRIQQLEKELEASNKELEQYDEKLVEANKSVQHLSVQQESSQSEIAFLREEQESDKVRIGDLEAAIAHTEQSLRDETERVRELDERLQQERTQRELVANQEKEDVQQLLNELNRETSTAKDEAKWLRKSLTKREVEATEWKERLMELENNLREALGDLNGTRSSLLKSITRIQRELEDTIRELDTSKASVAEKDRIIKQRDALLESHALESRKVNEMLDKERSAHRTTKSQFDTFQKTHQHLTKTATTQDTRIAELESTRGHDRRRLASLEQTARDQLAERNELLLLLWRRLSTLCGREWANGHALVDRQVLPSLEVVASRLPGFSKNLLAAVKTIETMFSSFETKIKSVERDLTREYQALEGNLDARTKKLDRLETMVRNSVATGSMGSQDMKSRLSRVEDAYRQLKVENATLRTASDVRSRAAQSSPSPAIHRGPGEREKGSSNRNASTSHLDVAKVEETSSGSSNDNRWLLRLRDLEYKLKMEREGRNQDRQVARQRLGGLESENKELRDKAKRTASRAE